MSNIRFLIRNNKSAKPVAINYDISISRKFRLRGPTKYKINPQYWDNRHQKVRNRLEVQKVKDGINKKLSSFKAYVFEKLNDYEALENEEQATLLKKDIQIYFGNSKKDVNAAVTFYSFAETFIDQSRNRIIEKTGKPISFGTIKEYIRTVTLLKDFEKEHDYNISFETINLDFYYAFKNYLEGLNFSLNTIGKFIKQLKVFMNAATEQGLNTNLNYKNKRFIKTSAKSDQIYLDEDELDRLIKLDLSKKPVLERARDLFIIGAYTGLRVSDFNGLTKDNIYVYKGRNVFRLTVKKTGNYLPIPIHPIIENILEKNNGEPPKKMPNQHINKALKEIGEIAGIDIIVTTNIMKGGVTITEKRPKYELITNHTARRSFCTNAYKSGMSTLDIMSISGHTSEKTFLDCIKISADERAVKIAESDFFKLLSKPTCPITFFPNMDRKYWS